MNNKKKELKIENKNEDKTNEESEKVEKTKELLEDDKKTEENIGKIKKLKKIFLFSKKERELSKEEKERQLAQEKKSKNKIFYHIFQDFLGYGRINIVMEDEGIEDISCDGHHVPIFIYHKKYDAIPTNIKYRDEKELDSFVVRLAQICGKQISIYSPIVDGKLPDGSRLQTTLARTVTRESTFTIRKFKENPLTPIDLISFHSLSLDMAAYFWMAIERGASILFCGGTASGKTTALNALSLFIPAQSKIISIEDTREVNLPHKNWIAGTTRQGFSASDEKTGKDIDMFDLIRAALRQRPKVVIVGEVRGKEAYSLFQAMATGHTSYATVHASDIHTLIQRLENPPISLPRALLTSLDIIVFQNAVDIAGKTVRRMTSVTEVVKLDPDTNQLIFMEPFRWLSKTDDRFDSSAASKVLNNIRLQNDWDEERLSQEIENRKKILTWMLEKDIRDYRDIGRIVSDYEKYPEKILEIAEGEMKK
jgi:flagellar protein FlaI